MPVYDFGLVMDSEICPADDKCSASCAVADTEGEEAGNERDIS